MVENSSKPKQNPPGVNRRALSRLGRLGELLAQLLGFLATDQFDHEVTRLFDVVIRALVILAPVVGHDEV